MEERDKSKWGWEARFFRKVGRRNFPKDNLHSRAPVPFSEINTWNIFQRCNENISLKC